jgi:hypothetical protein
MVLGHLVDTQGWRSTPEAVSTAAEALARPETDFHDVTDAWSGRYLVLFGTDGALRAMTDAGGVRSAFFTLEGPLVLASHARLAAEIIGATPAPLFELYRALRDDRSWSGPMPMPGRSTPWSGVVHLTANTALDLESRRLRRLFPRAPIPSAVPQEAAAALAPRLTGQVTSLAETGRPIAISITAGVDSRVTLAASRARRDDVTYFTYHLDGSTRDDEDVEVAGAMAAELALPYRVLHYDENSASAALRDAITEATSFSHGQAIVGGYQATFPPDTIHVRSNLGEIGRAFYRRQRAGVAIAVEATDVTPEDLARLWGHDDPSPPIVEAFDEWMQATAFGAAEGIDPLDLFYWEHRMSCWHANVVLESDFAFETHVLFDSRWILARLLSVPLGARRKGAVFRHLGSMLWPELDGWPTGGRSTPPAHERRHGRRWAILRRP